MSDLVVVENPRRRRRGRRRMTAKQARYFGPRARRRRRRNPVLATLAGVNPRRRTRRYHRMARGRRRRYRNPSFLGGLKSLFDFKSILYVTLGMVASKQVPNLVAQAWPAVPRTGLAGYGVRLAGTYVLAQAVKMVIKQHDVANKIMIGGIASVAYDLFNEYLGPTLGLSGLGSYGPVIRRSDVSTALGHGGLGTYSRGVTGRGGAPLFMVG